MNTVTYNDLINKVVVITGACGGIGKDLVRSFSDNKCKVVMIDKNLDELEKFSQELELKKVEHLIYHADIINEDEIKRIVFDVKNHYKNVNILVNNAAIMPDLQGIEQTSVEQWNKVFNINVIGTFICIKYFGDMLKESSGSSIINIASIASMMPNNCTPYSASKSAILGLTRQVSVEWGKYGIRTNAICPGFIRTPLSEVFYEKEENYYRRSNIVPLKTIGVGKDISNTALFLASDNSSYINGQDITVDGGFMKMPLINSQLT